MLMDVKTAKPAFQKNRNEISLPSVDFRKFSSFLMRNYGEAQRTLIQFDPAENGV